MADEKNVYVKQKIVAQDVELGMGKVVQIRVGQRVEGDQINSFNIPYDASRSIGDVLKELLDANGLS